MIVEQCDEQGLTEELKVQAPMLWHFIESVMIMDARYRSKITDHAKEVGVHNTFMIINHILKIRGANILIARAAKVGIFLNTQGNL